MSSTITSSFSRQHRREPAPGMTANVESSLKPRNRYCSFRTPPFGISPRVSAPRDPEDGVRGRLSAYRPRNRGGPRRVRFSHKSTSSAKSTKTTNRAAFGLLSAVGQGPRTCSGGSGTSRRGRDNNKESLVVCGRPGEVGGEDGQYRVERWGKNRNHRRRGHGRDSGHPAREGGVSKCQS